MANKYNKSSRNNTGMPLAVATVAVPVLQKLIDVIEPLIPKPNSGKELVIVPQLYKKGFPLELKQATDILANVGLKAVPSKLTIKEAHPRYKDCFDMQVVSADPAPMQKADVGSSVVVRYVTQEIIDESQRIFDEEMQRKSDLAAAKAEKRLAQREQVKAVIGDAAKKAQHGVTEILPGHKKAKRSRYNGD